MVHETVKRRTDYSAPQLTYHGRVHDLTLGHHVDFGVHAFQMAAAFSSSVITSNNPQPSGGGGGNTTNVTQTLPQEATGGGVPTGGGNLPAGAVNESLPPGVQGVAQSGATPGATTTTAAATEGGRLPFTGVAVGLMAGAGLAAASGGALLKRVARRGS